MRVRGPLLAAASLAFLGCGNSGALELYQPLPGTGGGGRGGAPATTGVTGGAGGQRDTPSGGTAGATSGGAATAAGGQSSGGAGGVSCLSAADCSDSLACAAGRCVERCAVDDDCHSGEVARCLLPPGGCVGCLGASDCAGQSDRPVCNPTTLECVECAADTDCPQDKPGCLPATQRCEDCSKDAQCAAGEQCDLSDGKCR